jgi:hypothetical protein
MYCPGPEPKRRRSRYSVAKPVQGGAGKPLKDIVLLNACVRSSLPLIALGVAGCLHPTPHTETYARPHYAVDTSFDSKVAAGPAAGNAQVTLTVTVTVATRETCTGDFERLAGRRATGCRSDASPTSASVTLGDRAFGGAGGTYSLTTSWAEDYRIGVTVATGHALIHVHAPPRLEATVAPRSDGAIAVSWSPAIRASLRLLRPDGLQEAIQVRRADGLRYDLFPGPLPVGRADLPPGTFAPGDHMLVLSDSVAGSRGRMATARMRPLRWRRPGSSSMPA